jgi:hypothetical protein
VTSPSTTAGAIGFVRRSRVVVRAAPRRIAGTRRVRRARRGDRPLPAMRLEGIALDPDLQAREREQMTTALNATATAAATTLGQQPDDFGPCAFAAATISILQTIPESRDRDGTPTRFDRRSRSYAPASTLSDSNRPCSITPPRRETSNVHDADGDRKTPDPVSLEQASVAVDGRVSLLANLETPEAKWAASREPKLRSIQAILSSPTRSCAEQRHDEQSSHPREAHARLLMGQKQQPAPAAADNYFATRIAPDQARSAATCSVPGPG